MRANFNSLAARLVAVILVIAGWAEANGEEGARESAETAAPRPESGGKEEDSGRRDQGGEERDRPAPLDPFFNAIDPARLHRFLDQRFGFDFSESSARPKAPEIPEPVFFDVVRPLGDLKYANEINYLLHSSTRNAPTLQIIECEYVFADWKAVELDLSYFNGNLEILTPFYQRTLGVGPRRNWVHGYQISPEIYPRSRFVGGSAVYMLGWKPEEESRFSALFFIGANRALIGGFAPIGTGIPGLHFTTSLPAGSQSDRTFAAWRPTFNVNLFYKINDRFTLGIENDLFFHSGNAGEYLVLPFLTWEAGKHAFFQVGAGYYHFESVDQGTFMCHVNLVNATRRTTRESESRPNEHEAETEKEGRLKRCINRLLGDRGR